MQLIFGVVQMKQVNFFIQKKQEIRNNIKLSITLLNVRKLNFQVRLEINIENYLLFLSFFAIFRIKYPAQINGRYNTMDK